MRSLSETASAVVCLGAALAGTAFAALPGAAIAQQRGRPAPARTAPPAAPALDLVRGASEAPAAVQAARVRCSVTEAAFIGGSARTVNGVSVPQNAYEVACREGLGFVVVTPQVAGAAPALAVDCVTAQTTARLDQAAARPVGIQCRLPANAQPAQGLQALAREAGATCTVSNARAVGTLTQSGASRYEIACSEGAGYMLDRPATAEGKPEVQTCFRAEAVSGGQFRCEFTTKAQSLAALAPLITASRRSCTLSDARLVGRNPQSNNEVLEVGCGAQPGFFVEIAGNGGFVSTFDCGRFGNTACEFTTSAAAQARSAESFSSLLRAAGFECNVSRFERFGVERSTGREIVEAACSNRPEGAFALIASSGAGAARTEVQDCLVAAVRFKMTCKLTPVALLYPAITATLPSQKLGRDCTVTNSRPLGATPSGQNWIEIGCSNGRSYLVDYRGRGRISEIVACGQAATIFGGCRRGFPDSRPPVGAQG